MPVPPGVDWVSQILADPPGRGAFRYRPPEDVAPDVVHPTSWASGFGSQLNAYLYRRHFGHLPPRWILALHPYHQACLCSRAKKLNTPLPDHWETQE